MSAPTDLEAPCDWLAVHPGWVASLDGSPVLGVLLPICAKPQVLAALGDRWVESEGLAPGYLTSGCGGGDDPPSATGGELRQLLSPSVGSWGSSKNTYVSLSGQEVYTRCGGGPRPPPWWGGI